MSKSITDFFAEKDIEEIARETNFVQRDTAKVKGYPFLDTLLYTGFNQEKLSLNDLCTQFEDNHDIDITKQGLDQRFTEKSKNFMKAVLEHLLNKLISEKTVIEFLKEFKSVRIKDSTSFQLPADMAEIYPGSGGSASKAQIRIQFEYDIRTGKIYDLSLHPFNTQDTIDAQETVSSIEENDLIIRDLGYIVIKVLKEIEDKDAWFINRFNFSSNAYEQTEHQYKQLDFAKIQKYMNKNNINIIEKEVYIGAKKTLKVRMIIERLPVEKIKLRLQKAEENARSRGSSLSAKAKSHIMLNVYITNISSVKLPNTKVRFLYGLRWQIELIFKVWKSVGEIHKVKQMKVARFETMLFAKLIWIVMNWTILWEISKELWKEKRILISPIKLFKTLKNRMTKFQIAMAKGKSAVAAFINKIWKISPRHHNLEQKKNHISSLETIMLLCV